MAKKQLRLHWWEYIAPGKPDNLKKIIYLLASAFLGILVSFICYAWIEIRTIQSMYHRGNLAYFQSSREIFQTLEYIFLSLGALGGFVAGNFFWRKIYIEKTWMKKIDKFIRK
jgi:hypothetical protein